MVRIAKLFRDSVLWPEYTKYVSILNRLTAEISTDLIAKIHLVKEEDEETIIVVEIPMMSEPAAL